MSGLEIRTYRPGDAAEVVRINASAAHWTSEMSAERWHELAGMAALVLVAEVGGTVVGFVLVLGDDAPYDSDNYGWFRDRVRRFCYVDRIVVDERARGTGAGRALYAAVARWGREHDYAWVAAEVVQEPPNAVSLAFHERMGYRVVGTKPHADKQLAMFLLPLEPTEADEGR